MDSRSSPFSSTPSVESTTSNIQIFLRIRALLYDEYEAFGVSTTSVLSGRTVAIEYPEEFEKSVNRSRRNRSGEGTRKFAYDLVFDDTVDQREIFDHAASPLIDSVLSGINSTIFAYGATGAGKTYTMIGTNDNPGIMVLSLSELFNRISNFRDINIKCSFIEIYNEVVRDLLSDVVLPLDIREDPRTGTTLIDGVTEIVGISRIEQMMQLLILGNQRRSTEPTAANETSSRSHAILQVILEQTQNGETVYSKLSLIDLAGSERAKATQNRGIRFIEGGNINKSLLALGNCIKALSTPGAFIPYRDSKLTRLLRDSLGGNCKTVMIANVSPFVGHYTDSLNTLKFAIRARNVKMQIVRNSRFDNPRDEIRKFKKIIQEQNLIIQNLRAQLRDNDSSSDSFVSEEWNIKKNIMDTISEQILLRDKIAELDNAGKGVVSSERSALMKALQENNDRSNWLHQQQGTLSRSKSTVSLHLSTTPDLVDSLPTELVRPMAPARSKPAQRVALMVRKPSAPRISGSIHFN